MARRYFWEQILIGVHDAGCERANYQWSLPASQLPAHLSSPFACDPLDFSETPTGICRDDQKKPNRWLRPSETPQPPSEIRPALRIQYAVWVWFRLRDPSLAVPNITRLVCPACGSATQCVLTLAHQAPWTHHWAPIPQISLVHISLSFPAEFVARGLYKGSFDSKHIITHTGTQTHTRTSIGSFAKKIINLVTIVAYDDRAFHETGVSSRG